MRQGFSLIELMIVLVIISLFTCFAYPIYLNHLMQARRYDGQAALFDLANRLEHYYSEYHSYEKASLGTGEVTDIKNDNLSAQKWYCLKISSQTHTAYSLQAIPRGAQTKDKDCQSFTLDNLGHRGIAPGPHGDPLRKADECW
ncbi:type IV pilin protein [Legionella lansingensis]|nr:type IV pilin protein [Legionella lansingensis]